jgi:hypothetical protein
VPIGLLYNAGNVVVGQAACYIAPKNTPLPALTYFGTGTAKLLDPFDPGPFTQTRVGLTSGGPITAGTFTMTYTLNGVAYTTASATATTETAAAFAAKIVTALAPLAALASEVIVTGGPVSALATPFNIVLAERLLGGTWTLTPTGITGGTLVVTQPLWTPVGATDQGWKFSSDKTTQTINIEEQSAPVLTTMQAQVITVEGVLSEDISRTITTVYNMTTALTAPATGVPGYETLTLTDSVIEYAVVLQMANQLTYPRWLYIPSTTCLGNVDTELRRAAAKRMYSAVFTSDCPVGSIQIINIIAAGT